MYVKLDKHIRREIGPDELPELKARWGGTHGRNGGRVHWHFSTMTQIRLSTGRSRQIRRPAANTNEKGFAWALPNSAEMFGSARAMLALPSNSTAMPSESERRGGR